MHNCPPRGFSTSHEARGAGCWQRRAAWKGTSVFPFHPSPPQTHPLIWNRSFSCPEGDLWSSGASRRTDHHPGLSWQLRAVCGVPGIILVSWVQRDVPLALGDVKAGSPLSGSPQGQTPWVRVSSREGARLMQTSAFPLRLRFSGESLLF